MERRLRNDMAQEAAAWGGRVMLHAEMPPTTAAAASPESQNGGHHATMERAMSRVASGPVMDKSPFSMAERQSDGAPDHQDGDAGKDGGAAAGAEQLRSSPTLVQVGQVKHGSDPCAAASDARSSTTGRRHFAEGLYDVVLCRVTLLERHAFPRQGLLPLHDMITWCAGGARSSPGDSNGQDAITRNTEDLASSMQLVAYWEPTGGQGDIDTGLCTPREARR